MRRLVIASVVLATTFAAGCGRSDPPPAPPPPSPSTSVTSDPAQPSASAPTTPPAEKPVSVADLRLRVGELGPVTAGDRVTDVVGPFFQPAPAPCARQRLDPVGVDNESFAFPTLMVRESEQRIVLITAGTSTRTTTGAGVGWSEADLRLVYKDSLLATEVTGEMAYLKVVRGTKILQFNLAEGAVEQMYTYDVRDWDGLGGGDPRGPGVFLDGLGGQC